MTPTEYQFTGQFSDSYINLLWYGSRHYDPAIGRFAQADSIVPGGVQGLDRYAYVNNAPTRFTDPSGHKCVGDGNECTATSHSNTEPALTHADPDNGKPYGGDEFLELYNLMVGCTACWWYSNGNFTFEMFVGFLLMHEGSGEFLYSMLDAFAGAQQVYVGGGGKGTLGPYCPSGICMNGVLNYFAAFSESARNLVDEYVRNGTDISNYMGFGGRAINDPARVISEANLYGSTMLYPKPTIFYAPNQDVNVSWTLDPNPMSGLSNYGNGHKDLVVELNKNGLAANTFYPGGYMGIYYYTGKKGYYSVWMSAGGEQSWSP